MKIIRYLAEFLQLLRIHWQNMSPAGIPALLSPFNIIISIEMSVSNQVIKIFSFAEPRSKEFSKQQFRTMHEFQKSLQEWFQIEVSDQKIVKDGEVVTLVGWAPFQQLDLKSETSLRLLTKEPRSFKHEGPSIKNESAPEVKKEQRNSEEIEERKVEMQKKTVAVEDKAVEASEVVAQLQSIYYLKEGAVDKIITIFIKQMKIPMPELLLINEPKLQFTLHKIAAGNPVLQKLFQEKIEVVKMSLLDEEVLSSTKDIPSTLIADQVNDLAKLNYPEERIVRALQISRNNIEMAFEILHNNKQSEYVIQFPEQRRQNVIDEYKSLYSWFAQKENESQVILANISANYLDVYVNSIKHRCPDLHQIMVRWYPYLHRLIAHLLKHPQPAESPQAPLLMSQ